MKKMLVSAIGAIVALAQPAQASWISCCRTVVPCYTTCYVEQAVTSYHPVYKEVSVPVTVHKTVAKEVPYTYYECVPVTTQQKFIYVEYKTVAKEVPYTYYECVPVTTQQKAKQIEYKTITKQVPFKYYECVPVTTQQKFNYVEYH